MKQFQYIAKEPDISKVIITSLVLHLVLISLIAVPKTSVKKEYKSYYVNIVTPAEIRRTPAAKTPRTVSKKRVPPKTVLPKTVTKKMVVPKKGVILQPADRVSREIERLQSIRTLEKKKMRDASENEAKETVAAALENIRKRKAAVLSIGIGSSGTTSSEEDKDSYYSLIIKKIQQEWLHTDFNSKELEAIISFRMDDKGNVVTHKITKSSGNTMFDRTAVKAIIKASPLPPHPYEKEVEVKFHL